LLAVQQQQQQQQQQHANNGAAAVASYHPGLAATLSPAALASFFANAGGAATGRVLPGKLVITCC
jgi:hypothetical protein